MVPDTDYNISFSYKTPDIQLNNDAYNLCNFQVRTTGGQYARFNGYILIIWKAQTQLNTMRGAKQTARWLSD
ncbi:MAG: hypothetical protein ACLR56_12675 [Oscillospiraceae bacterium]